MLNCNQQGDWDCEAIEGRENQDAQGIADDKATLLIAAGAALAANCEPCLNKAVTSLLEAGVPEEDIRGAVEIGQFVKDRPAALMKEAADLLTGTRLSEKSASQDCPAEKIRHEARYPVVMLIAAASAIAANCEPCLNQAIPNLIEAGVAEADIRKAVEIGQFVKDRAAASMKEAADLLTGTQLLDQPVSEGCPSHETKQPVSCCA